MKFWILSKVFSPAIEMIIFFFFLPVSVMIYIDCFLNAKQLTVISWNKLNKARCVIPIAYCWNLSSNSGLRQPRGAESQDDPLALFFLKSRGQAFILLNSLVFGGSCLKWCGDILGDQSLWLLEIPIEGLLWKLSAANTPVESGISDSVWKSVCQSIAAVLLAS